MRPLAVVGVAAVAAGFLVVFDAGLAEAFGLSTFVVTLIGVLGVLQGIRYVNARRGRDRATVTLGEPERREPATVPGADLDGEIRRAAGGRLRRRRTRERIQGRVRSVAVRTVARRRNHPHDRAEALVESGEWTDDPTAAAFLSSSVRYPLRDRLRGGLFGRPTYHVGVLAALAEIERLDRGVEAGAEGGAEADERGRPDR